MRTLFIALATTFAVLAHGVNSESNPGIPDAPETNAKRFALGLPPLKPKFHPKRLGTGVRTAPRPRTSPPPPNYISCHIFATRYSGGTPFGYLSPAWNANNTYYEFQETPENALLVSFPYSESNDRQLSLFASNGPQHEKYPYLGAVVAPDSPGNNLGYGSNSYAYLTGTTATPPGSIAVSGPNAFDDKQRIQTAIWIYGQLELLVQWVNPQDSPNPMPTTHFMYLFNEKRLIVTLDPLSIFNAYPSGSVDILRLKCLPPGTPPPS